MAFRLLPEGRRIAGSHDASFASGACCGGETVVVRTSRSCHSTEKGRYE